MEDKGINTENKQEEIQKEKNMEDKGVDTEIKQEEIQTEKKEIDMSLLIWKTKKKKMK